jgi:hypothetical protein
MRSIRVWGPLLQIMLAAAAVNAASRDVDGLAGKLKTAATFCDETYALCIKAPCTPILSGNGREIESALCTCDVVDGWSMGPAGCPGRKPVQRGHYKFLMSTYSNLFNATNKTLSCASAKTQWALCYGAPCVVTRATRRRQAAPVR